MAEVYGLKIDDLPENATPLDAIVIVKYLNEEAEPRLHCMVTNGLMIWEALGILKGYAAEAEKKFIEDPGD